MKHAGALPDVQYQMMMTLSACSGVQGNTVLDPQKLSPKVVPEPVTAALGEG